MRPIAILTPHGAADVERGQPPDGVPHPLEALDDVVLLDRLLATTQHQTISKDLIVRFGSLGDVMAADRTELARVPGVDPEMIVALKIVREVCVRLARHRANQRPVLSSWVSVRDYAVTALAHLPREQFRALYLDRRNILIREELVAEGTVDFAPVYPREVIRRALEVSASALILIHNHPSGDPTPSQADITMTRQIVSAAKVFGLTVHDHLVVGREGTASFRALGLM